MIVSKPQFSTLLSFAVFLFITGVVIGMNVSVIVNSAQAPWYSYAILGALTPIFFIVFYRIFIRYKVVRFGNNQIEIQFPMMRKKKIYSLNDVFFWIEHRVKTGKNTTYRELGIGFVDKQKVTLGHREYTEYEKALKYLQQKIPKKKKEAA